MSPNNSSTENINTQKLMLKSAQSAQSHSYSPYSHCKVGAAVLAASGKIYSGCNVENASYGGTVCAERVAIFKAISEGENKLTALLVYTEADEPWPPCGICRQSLVEHLGSDSLVYLANAQGVQVTLTVEELVPRAFSGAHL